MPILDMPLEELRLYKGRGPCPKDFDAFWDEGLRELEQTPPEAELRPARFALKGFDCYDLFFTGVQNAKIHAKLIKPASGARLPVALHFHGYSTRASDWHEYIAWAAAGFCVLAMDCRGQGGESADMGGVGGNTLNGHIIRGLSQGKNSLLFRQIFLDTAQLARVAAQLPFTDAARLCVYGGSQGGGLALACAGLVPQVKYLAPMYPFLCDYKRVIELNLPTDAYKELKDYFRRFDPTCEREEETFNTLAYIDAVNLARRIKGKVLLAVTLNDDICPPSTVFAAYNAISSQKDIRIYPHHGHEALPGFLDEVIQKFQNALC